MRKHWYMIDVIYCPACGRTTTWRTRMYTERPVKWEDRHSDREVYDYCD
jgi:hypothetical protein